MGRAALPPAKKKAILAAKLEGKSVRQIAAEVDVAKNTVSNVWTDPRNFAVLAQERAKRTGLVGQVLDAVYSSLIKELQSDKADKSALRTHALEVLAKGEPELRAVLPQLMPAESPSSPSGGFTLQEVLLSVRQGHGTPPNGANGAVVNGNGHGPEHS